MLQGFKTIIFGMLLSCLPPAMHYLGGVDWTQVIPPSLVWASPMIIGAITLLLRAITKTAIFQQAQSVNPADPKLGGLD